MEKDLKRKPQIRPIIKKLEDDALEAEKDAIIYRLQKQLYDLHREIELNWGRLYYANPAVKLTVQGIGNQLLAMSQMLDYPSDKHVKVIEEYESGTSKPASGLTFGIIKEQIDD